MNCIKYDEDDVFIAASYYYCSRRLPEKFQLKDFFLTYPNFYALIIFHIFFISIIIVLMLDDDKKRKFLFIKILNFQKKNFSHGLLHKKNQSQINQKNVILTLIKKKSLAKI